MLVGSEHLFEAVYFVLSVLAMPNPWTASTYLNAPLKLEHDFLLLLEVTVC